MKEIALHILDIGENAIAAGADKMVIRLLKTEDEMLSVSVLDNGSAMDEDVLKLVLDPFYTSRTTRKVGMGIPLFRQHAEMTGGSIEIVSEKGKGTETKAIFDLKHPDVQPLGDIEGVWLMLAGSYPEIEFELNIETVEDSFSINTTEVKEVLGVEKLVGKDIKEPLKRLIRNNVDELGFV